MFLQMCEMMEGSIRGEVPSFSRDFSIFLSMMLRRSDPEVRKYNMDDERHLLQLKQDNFHIIFRRGNYLDLKH